LFNRLILKENQHRKKCPAFAPLYPISERRNKDMVSLMKFLQSFYISRVDNYDGEFCFSKSLMIATPYILSPNGKNRMSIMGTRCWLVKCKTWYYSLPDKSFVGYKTKSRFEMNAGSFGFFITSLIFCLSIKLNFSFNSISNYRRSSTMGFRSFYGTQRNDLRRNNPAAKWPATKWPVTK
jgi:hypothetical protein